MKFRSVMLALGMAAFPFLISAHDLKAEEFSVAGISKETPAMDALGKMGEPLLVGMVPDDSDGILLSGSEEVVLIYPSMAVLVNMEDEKAPVHALSVMYDSDEKLPRDVRVGDRWEKVQRLYGKATSDKLLPNGDRVVTYESDGGRPEFIMKFRKNQLIGAFLLFR